MTINRGVSPPGFPHVRKLVGSVYLRGAVECVPGLCG